MKRINIFLLIMFSLIILFSLAKIYKFKFGNEEITEKIHYSEKTALENIETNHIILVTHDKEKYKLNKKHNYTEQFGFQYQYELEDDILTKHDEYDKISNRYNISYYNWEIEKHLVSKDSFWHKKIEAIEDSLAFLTIDKYGRKYPIAVKSLKIPKKEDLPQTMINAIEEIKSDAEWHYRRYEKDSLCSLELTKYQAEFILDKIDNNTKYNYIWITQFWIAYHYEKVLIELIERIADNTEVGLSNELIVIRERWEIGEMPWQEHFGIVDDDIYKVSGRANHLLKIITGEDFGHISIYHTEKDLKRIQHRWAYWLKNINKKKNWF